MRSFIKVMHELCHSVLKIHPIAFQNNNLCNNCSIYKYLAKKRLKEKINLKDYEFVVELKLLSANIVRLQEED